MNAPDKKLPVEVRGNMSRKGADRVGMLMTIMMMFERLWWKSAIVIILAALFINACSTKPGVSTVDIGELASNERTYACIIAVHPRNRDVEFTCLRTTTASH